MSRITTKSLRSCDSAKGLIFDIIIWTLIVLWCIAIFCFSAEDADSSSGTSGGVCQMIASVVDRDFDDLNYETRLEIIEKMQFAVRKTAHFSAYALLGFLFCLALRRLKISKRYPLALLLTVLYAVSDEVHQLFVSGRSGRISDVFIDGMGGALGAALALLVYKLWQRHQSRSLSSMPLK